MSKQYKLCYVAGNVLYFTDNFKRQSADDWNDRPYECNAGEPYEWDGELTAEESLDIPLNFYPACGRKLGY